MTVILSNSELAIYEALMGHCHKASRSMQNCNSSNFHSCSEVHAGNSQCIFHKWVHNSHFADVERDGPGASALPELNSGEGGARKPCREEKGRSGGSISSSRHPTELLPYPLSHMKRETWPTSSHHLSTDIRLKVEDRRIPHKIASRSSSLWMTNSSIGISWIFSGATLFNRYFHCIFN